METMRTMGRWVQLACMLALLAGCAASPTSSGGRERSDALLQVQLARAKQALAAGAPPRVVFAGFALHSESKAFRGDVVVAEQAMRLVLFHRGSARVDWGQVVSSPARAAGWRLRQTVRSRN